MCVYLDLCPLQGMLTLLAGDVGTFCSFLVDNSAWDYSVLFFVCFAFHVAHGDVLLLFLP